MNSEKTKAFIELVKNNPDLPIIPIVDSEVVIDDGCNYWLGSFADSYVSEYVVASVHGENRIYLESETDLLEEYIADELCDDEDGAELSDKEIEQLARDRVKNLPWKKAIIVYIGMPDVE